METKKTSTPHRAFLGVLFLVVGSVSMLANYAQAQEGLKAVWGASNVQPSSVWIDASPFCGGGCTNNTDFCSALNQALSMLQTQYPQGGVVDARGVVAPTGGPLKCGGNPWSIPTNITVPSTVLLPNANIKIQTTWVLPDNTKLIGSGNTFLTATDTFVGMEMIDMGSSNSCPLGACSGVAIKDLNLSDQTTSSGTFGGIVNQYSQTPSYVNNVNFTNIKGTGLAIAGPSSMAPGAIDSGPYTNITFIANSTSSSSVCVDIETQTRGLHGITCNGSGTTGTTPGTAGIYVNASNNTIEDVHIQGFWDGVEIGNNNSAVGNVVVSNVEGTTGQSAAQGCTNGSCAVTNTVHICGPIHSGYFSNCPLNTSATPTVSDASILGATDDSGGGTISMKSSTTSIQDDVTGTSIAAPTTVPTNIPWTTGIYILGEPLGGISGASSRFTTSPSPSDPNNTGSTLTPTWGVGSGLASGSCNVPGALYSNTQGSSHSTGYVCTGQNSAFTWVSIF
jgi:hypothetical protein